MTALLLKGLCKEYQLQQQQVQALVNVDLTVAGGSFVTIVGKSGCGKTTLLRIIAGLEGRSGGEIILDPPDARVGMVFQEPRLMPWLMVEQNMALAMPPGEGRERIEPIVRQYLEILGLTPFRHAYPAQISSGMAQRVALGRALCYNSDIILMDEPLSALDAFTRRNLQEELLSIFQRHNKTILFVTHDVDEALIMGQRVLVMDGGRIIRDYPVPFPYPRAVGSEPFFRLRENLFLAITGNSH
jgi:sulfonate transport system ATP-binding protein